MSFYDKFTKLNIPVLENGVRLPEFKPSAEQYSELDLPNTATSKQVIQRLCEIGFKKLVETKVDKSQHEVYRKRIEEELDVMEQLGFIDYILMVWDVCYFCEKNGIPRGLGRGSVSSSLVCYLLDITKVDSIKHGTYFTRFLSKSRAKYKIIDGIKYIDGSLAPDIDQDIDYFRREEVIKYLGEKYPHRTCKLLTTQTFTSKILIKEVLKKLEEANEDEAKHVSDLIEKVHGVPQEIYEALSDDPEKSNDKFKEWAKGHEETVKIAQKLAGLQKSMGIHASAIAISYDPIENIIPLQLSTTGEVATGYDMYAAQELCLKFDELGLKTASLIDIVCKMVGIKPEDIDVNHPSIYQFFNNNQGLHGIFQFESHAQGEVIQKIRPQHFKHLVDALAIARPGAFSFLGQYLDYIHDGTYKEIHPLIDPILKETGGVCLFQETLLKMVNTLGMELDECEGLRKAIGKKLPEKIKEYKEKIYSICEKNGHPKVVADLIWKIAEDSGGYQFNLSHSIAYAMISAQTAYLKANYPKEFYLGCLRIAREESDKIDIVGKVAQEMAKYGYKMLAPSLTKSELDFKIEGNNIRYGLSFIRGVSDKSIQKLLNFKEKEKNNKFQVFESLKQCGLNTGIGCALIQSGCMSDYGLSRPKLVLELQVWNVLTATEKKVAMSLGVQFDYDLVKVIAYMRDNKNDKGKPYIKETRLETIRKKYKPFQSIYNQNSKNEEFANWWYEKRVLGFSYTTTLREVFEKGGLNNLRPFNEIKTEVADVYVRGIGTVTKCYATKSKAGNAYLKCIVEDETGELHLKIFKQKMQLCKEVNNGYPEEGDIVTFRGTNKEGGTVFADEIIVQSSKIYMKLADLREDEV